jgi:hypothetical protein
MATISPSSAADYLGVSEAAVQDLARRGAIVGCMRDGNYSRCSAFDVETLKSYKARRDGQSAGGRRHGPRVQKGTMHAGATPRLPPDDRPTNAFGGRIGILDPSWFGDRVPDVPEALQVITDIAEFLKDMEGDDTVPDGWRPALRTQRERLVRGAPSSNGRVQVLTDTGGLLRQMERDPSGALPAGYTAPIQHHVRQLARVRQGLTDAGKVQRTGGPGRPLSDAGRTQANNGRGRPLTDEGRRQGTPPTSKTISPTVRKRLERFVCNAERMIRTRR